MLNREALVGLSLVAMTLLSYFFIESFDLGSLAIYMLPIISMLACIKALLVLHYYMELEHAPERVQYLAYGWVVAIGSAIIFMPRLAPLLAGFTVQ